MAKNKMKKYSKKQNSIIIKNAMMEEFANSLITAFKQVIDPKDPFGSVLQLITEGFIFSKWGFAGGAIAMLLDKAFGINMKLVLSTIKDLLGSFFKANNSGKIVDVEASATDLTNQALSTLGLSQDEAAKPLEQIQNENPELISNNFFDPKYHSKSFIKEASIFSAIMGLGVGGLIRTIIKAALIGAGFTAAGNLIANKGNGAANPSAGAAGVNPSAQQKSLLDLVGPIVGDKITNAIHPNSDDAHPWMIATADMGNNFHTWLRGCIFTVYPKMPPNVIEAIKPKLDGAISIVQRNFADVNDEADDNSGFLIVPAAINNIRIQSIQDIVKATLSLIKVK